MAKTTTREVVANRAFLTQNTLVPLGGRYAADDPIVVANPHRFNPSPTGRETSHATAITGFIAAVDGVPFTVKPGRKLATDHELVQRYPRKFTRDALTEAELESHRAAAEFNSPQAREQREQDSRRCREAALKRQEKRERQAERLEHRAAELRSPGIREAAEMFRDAGPFS